MFKLKTVFRYPGGKTKIAEPIIKEVLEINPTTFVDAFVGGGSVSVELIKQNPNIKMVLNDLDEYINAFWSIICSGNCSNLINIIRKQGTPTIEKFLEMRKNINDTTLEELAFRGIFFNRTTFSGIFRSGPIGGYDQSGKYKIHCRYNIDSMTKNIQKLCDILSKKGSITLKHDFRKVIELYGNDENALIYLDPPYMKQGKQLYNISMSEKDYSDMAELLKTTKCKWIVSHDNYTPFLKLFDGWAYISDTQNIPYTINSIKGNTIKELLISNFKLNHHKRGLGRPTITNNIYSIQCNKCLKKYKTIPKQIEKYCESKKINIDKIKNEYVCRICRRNYENRAIINNP